LANSIYAFTRAIDNGAIFSGVTALAEARALVAKTSAGAFIGARCISRINLSASSSLYSMSPLAKSQQKATNCHPLQ